MTGQNPPWPDVTQSGLFCFFLLPEAQSVLVNIRVHKLKLVVKNPYSVFFCERRSQLLYICHSGPELQQMKNKKNPKKLGGGVTVFFTAVKNL